MQKLNAFVTRSEIVSEEKASVCAKSPLDVTTLQAHSEEWKQL
jgi:hypothetical protein